jgi:hypothetical protein
MVAALLSEVAVVAVLILITTTYRFLIAPGKSAAEYQAFGDLAGYYVAPATAGLVAFFGALWATRKLSSAFVVNGTLVGIVGVLLSAGPFFVAEPEDRLMYGVSFLLRILGGYLRGLLAQRLSTRRSPFPLQV